MIDLKTTGGHPTASVNALKTSQDQIISSFNDESIGFSKPEGQHQRRQTSEDGGKDDDEVGHAVPNKGV